MHTRIEQGRVRQGVKLNTARTSRLLWAAEGVCLGQYHYIAVALDRSDHHAQKLSEKGLAT